MTPTGVSRPRVTRILGITVLALLVVGLVYAIGFRLHGGRWERVETPSMGTVAPVGSLLWVEPTDFDKLRVGDFITFHPPGEPAVTYSHRVHSVHADGTISTKGEISGVDPWRLHAADVVGQVHHVWRGAGWVVRAAPVLILGAILTWGAVLLARRRATLPLAVLGAGVTLAVAVIVFQPLTHAEQLSFVPVDGGAGGRATYVSTGLLPVRLQARDGDHVDLGPGQVGSVVSTQDSHDSRVSVSVRAAVPMWFWLLLVLGCFLPALWTVAFGAGGPAASRRHVAVA